MSAALAFSMRLETDECCNCGIAWAWPVEMRERRIKDGKTFWCPMGHGQSFTDDENTRLKKQLEAEKARHQASLARLNQAHATLADERKKAASLRKRAVAGACPCCKRSFVNMARHMKTKHPDYAHD